MSYEVQPKPRRPSHGGGRADEVAELVLGLHAQGALGFDVGIRCDGPYRGRVALSVFGLPADRERAEFPPASAPPYTSRSTRSTTPPRVTGLAPLPR